MAGKPIVFQCLIHKLQADYLALLCQFLHPLPLNTSQLSVLIYDLRKQRITVFWLMLLLPKFAATSQSKHSTGGL